ncbi:MAG: carboxymuconolactone decarboxylase [Flavobacterium sp.]|uniref:carboxymuconolactone decarboxylase family protein n=1 Tax=Flavobacterium sp. TaxID=239 RepID=UPI001207F2E4|nr:carboxymuconolactone decarboxylase family protein [Flavobacterium sp.]RZJ66920.1 MAG: carboxymuconolactone decarboxylase [Flavobacterium sp.]
MKRISQLFFIVLVSGSIDAQNSEKSLSAQQESMAAISALTAVGNIEQLKTELIAGLDSGLTINEIKEELVQLYAYCGFPRSLNAVNAFMAVLEDRKAKGKTDVVGKEATPVTDTNRYQTGKQTLQKLSGREEKTLSGANAFAPALDQFLKEHLFADIFSRDVLTYSQRELVTISALAAMTGTEAQLQSHIGLGLNNGISESQLGELWQIIEAKINKQQADIAKATFEKVKNPAKK